MVLRTANICAFGWKARDFALKGIDGKTYSLANVRGPKGTVATNSVEPFQCRAFKSRNPKRSGRTCGRHVRKTMTLPWEKRTI
jgi:hypothetical protein